jgi:hypothetical protein
MSKELMELIAGVLIFLGALTPIIANLWRWATQKGIHSSSLIALCLVLIGGAFFVTAIVGFFGKWDVSFVLLYLLLYAVFTLVSFTLLPGLPSRFEVAALVFSLASLAVLIGFLNTNSKFEVLFKAATKHASPASNAESTPPPK